MRVDDAEDSVYHGLKALPWRPSYLTAMWILCGELRSLYADSTSEDDRPVMALTMDLVREVVIYDESPESIGRARTLVNDWDRVRVAGEAGAPGGLLNVWITFDALAQEIAGLSGRYYATEWVTNAATERWRTWDRPGPIIVDPDEETDDSSPMAQTLELFGRVVSRVTAMQGPEWDPMRIRAQIFGQP
jgi:hypothetical protein